MSEYYCYYICRKDKDDGKLYPFGPFDYKGNFFPVLNSSRSFTSDLYNSFYSFHKEDDGEIISHELLRAVNTEISDEECDEYFKEMRYNDWSYLPYHELPKGDYVKSGYCLIEDIECFEKNATYFDGFTEWLTPEIYVKKLENELKFGAPEPVKDDYGDEYTPRSMREYSFYRWIDYNSPEYEAYVLRQAFEKLGGGFRDDIHEEEIYIVLVIE